MEFIMPEGMILHRTQPLGILLEDDSRVKHVVRFCDEATDLKESQDNVFYKENKVKQQYTVVLLGNTPERMLV